MVEGGWYKDEGEDRSSIKDGSHSRKSPQRKIKKIVTVRKPAQTHKTTVTTLQPLPVSHEPQRGHDERRVISPTNRQNRR